MLDESLDTEEILTADPIEAWCARIEAEERSPDAEWLAVNPEYEERPVDIRTFIESPEYMDAAAECWESIKEDLGPMFTGYDNARMDWQFTEVVFDEGIGAGKSYKASIMITYLIYRILIVKDPQTFLNLAKGSSLYFINMSVRGDQAKKIVFGEIVSRVMNAPWFKQRGYLPDLEIRSELRFPKNVNVIPGNSKETFPLGFNLLGGVMDEAAWYTETDSHDVAEEIFNALHNRIVNRFGNRGMLIMISSPRYIDDFIEKKMNETGENPKLYTVRHNSWEVKPAEQFSGKTFIKEGFEIPVEYEVEAKRNWDRFKRDYMAIPSLALEPYFKQQELIHACVDETLKDPVADKTTLFDWFKGVPGNQYFMHIDLSLVSDATGIAMVHKEEGKIIADLLLKIQPDKDHEIDLSEIRALVLALRQRGFNITKCTFDQFQSASSIQELTKMGIPSERLSVDSSLAPYETLKEEIYTGRFKMYKSNELLTELSRLELVHGKKVDHPPAGSKDLSDALAGAVYNCIVGMNCDFSFGFSQDLREHLSQEQVLKEAETLSAEGRVHYGFFTGRR